MINENSTIQEDKTDNDAECNLRLNRTHRLLASAKQDLVDAKKRLSLVGTNASGVNKIHTFLERQRAKSVVALLEYRIVYLEQELLFIRNKNQSDIEYRLLVRKEFSAELSTLFSKSHLLFHGASLIATLEIIKSKSISSTTERGLGQVSYDVDGSISVSSADAVQVSLVDYTGIKDLFIPMGCLFVIKNESSTINVTAIQSFSLFKDGKINPCLVAILASTESLPIIRSKLIECGYPAEIVLEYFAFLEN
ncbi:hypothetical protein KBC89_00530 [Candidatus Woesebacteria bacterium]|nr:hypothetical protein [Candidatus Woesebacteria bacterium]